MLDAADPIRALMADLGEPSADAVRLLKGEEQPTAEAVSTPTPGERQFLIYDGRRFGDVIDEVLTQLKADGVWKGDLKQQRRIMETFRWITGNRGLGTYNHLDVVAFKTGLQRLPVLSGLISPAGWPATLIEAWLDRRFSLISHEVQLAELRDVGRRDKIRALVKPSELGRMVNQIRLIADMPDALPRVQRSPDQRDDFLLALCQAGEADWLVTGDKNDLLALERHGGAHIATTATFAEALGFRR